jgi:hypothetical protein
MELESTQVLVRIMLLADFIMLGACPVSAEVVCRRHLRSIACQKHQTCVQLMHGGFCGHCSHSHVLQTAASETA